VEDKQKGEDAMKIKEGDICRVNMDIVKQESENFGGEHWLRNVQNAVRRGLEKVEVSNVKGNIAIVYSTHPADAMLGPVSIPVRALKIANVMDEILAMDDNALIPRDVVAQVCGGCAEKMDKQNIRALRASVIKTAYNEFQTKDSIKAAVKEFRGVSQVPQLELTKVPNKEGA
jgi:hypothetical protein